MNGLGYPAGGTRGHRAAQEHSGLGQAPHHRYKQGTKGAPGTDPSQGELPCSHVILIQETFLLLWLWLLSFSSRPPQQPWGTPGQRPRLAQGGSSSHTVANSFSIETLKPSEVISAVGSDSSTPPAPSAELLAEEGPAAPHLQQEPCSHHESRAAPRSSQPPLHPRQEPLPAKRNSKKQAFGYRGCCPGCVRARSQPQDAGPGNRGICSLLNRWLLQRGQARTGDYCWALTSSRKGKANFHPQQQQHAACGGATSITALE